MPNPLIQTQGLTRGFGFVSCSSWNRSQGRPSIHHLHSISTPKGPSPLPGLTFRHSFIYLSPPVFPPEVTTWNHNFFSVSTSFDNKYIISHPICLANLAFYDIADGYLRAVCLKTLYSHKRSQHSPPIICDVWHFFTSSHLTTCEIQAPVTALTFACFLHRYLLCSAASVFHPADFHFLLHHSSWTRSPSSPWEFICSLDNMSTVADVGWLVLSITHCLRKAHSSDDLGWCLAEILRAFIPLQPPS